MKIGFFTDSHFSKRTPPNKKRFNDQSLRKIREAYAFFEKEQCDRVICLGDLVDKDETHEEEIQNLQSVAEVIRASSLPTVSLMGNHDAFRFTVDEFYSVLGGMRPEDCIVEGKHLIFLDACYFANGNHYQPGESGWQDTFYPFEDELKSKLRACTGDTYLFLHQNVDEQIPESHLLANAERIRRIAEESGVVRTVYQGHYHNGTRSEKKGIRYVTFPAMCQWENMFFTESI